MPRPVGASLALYRRVRSDRRMREPDTTEALLTEGEGDG